MTFKLDHAAFAAEAVAPETQDLNLDISYKLSRLPDQWSFTPALVRERRRAGFGPFPLARKSDRAETIQIFGSHGPIDLRLIRPAGPIAGVYLHIHGGGWTLGASDYQDPMLEAIADASGLAALSVEYRLAPENPYPKGPDDCEAAALWLIREGLARIGGTKLAIGGESAGAHLSVVTCLRLRDKHGLTPFSAANLISGCFDLGLTPSARHWGYEKLVLNTRDIEMFVRHFLLHGGDTRDPDISPIQADLTGMPPALFSTGTRDPVLDDSLLMAMRWVSAGSPAELAVYPGGCHVFQLFDFPMAHRSIDRCGAFLKAAIETE